MSLIGIDVGTTGCKACAYSEDGDQLASAYVEYDIEHPQPGWAELDAAAVFVKVKDCIAQVAAETGADPISALSVSSLGEAVVPVSRDRRILGPSLLNFDARGEEYLERLGGLLDDRRLFELNGNTLGNHYALPKLLWLQEHEPGLFEQTYKFLLWGSFVGFMLGAEPVVDFSLANRTLLFDLEREAWSAEILEKVGIDADKLPATAPSGTVTGTVGDAVAAELGLPKGVAIVTGAHDQCANGVGCGVTQEGRAMLGMGTYLCVMPVYTERRDAALMIERGLNTEHHAVPGHFVSFIYNQGGSIVKWYRDTFAAEDKRAADAAGRDVYDALFAEMPEAPSSVLVLPHFTATGPPEFIADSAGVITGLRTETPRGDILKGIVEGTAFYLRACINDLPPTGIAITDFRAVGGGSKSDRWVQIAADILGRPCTRPCNTEAGALGAAILAGAATGVFASAQEGAETMVQLDRTFDPNAGMAERYTERFAQYAEMTPLLRDFLRRTC